MSKYFIEKYYGKSVRRFTKNGHSPMSNLSVLRELRTLERQLAEAKKSLGDSINYRVFNLNADEAIMALRRAKQLKEQG